MILKYLDKDNLHHAYLIEGERDVVIPEVLKFIEGLEVKITGNPDFCHMALDSFKIDDARNLKSMQAEKGLTQNKKIFVITANSILLEAQNSLLKIFEEPIEDTHFFLVVPDRGALLKTLVSRFHFISAKNPLAKGEAHASKFITMPLHRRLSFIKDLLTEPNEASAISDSVRSKSLLFLNALEDALHNKLFQESVPGVPPDVNIFHHIYKVREFLRMPGSSPKILLESLALIVPNFN